MRWWTPPARILANLSGVRHFDLLSDFAARGHVGDVVNWCDMLLVGKP